MLGDVFCQAFTAFVPGINPACPSANIESPIISETINPILFQSVIDAVCVPIQSLQNTSFFLQ